LLVGIAVSSVVVGTRTMVRRGFGAVGLSFSRILITTR
jgi:hypothetical protein